MTDRFAEFVEDITAKAEMAGSPLPLDSPRTWTDINGRTLIGVLVSKDDSSALVRVVANQRVYRIPNHRLSEADRSYLANWSSQESESLGFPEVPPQWPTVLGGASAAPPVTRLPDGSGWRSAHYDFISSEPVDPQVVRELAHTCETVHRIAGQTPLPLRWGRSHVARRQIILYSDQYGFTQSGMKDNWGGAFNPVDNKIHFPLTSLAAPGSENLAEFDASRRKSFKVLVHELAHQESIGFVVLDCPPWCGEGIAELFSAMQRAPGVFVFNNPQLSIKRQIHYQIGFGADSAQLRLNRLSLPTLENFFDISLARFNAEAKKSEGAAASYYAGSLLLVDYFCFADGNSLRPYLEAVLTGVPRSEAAERHLLRGRSFKAIEGAMTERWEKHSLSLAFEKRAQVSRADVEVRRNDTFDRFRQ